MEEQEPTEIKINTNKFVCDDRSYSTMYVSLDRDRILIWKKKKKLSETSITGKKITQDQDNMSK